MAAAKQTGFMHSIKEKLFHGEKHVDSDYEASLQKFNLLNDNMLKIRGSSQSYISSVYSVFLNGNNVAVDFGALLEEASAPNPYQTLCAESRTAHAKLNSDKQQQLSAELAEKVIKPIDIEVKNFQALQTRINKRNELHSNLEYYLNKVFSLTKDREERAAKGKPESSSNIEKFDRNQTKLNLARTEYSTYTAGLMADLNNAWNGRIPLLGPALASFIEAEKHFVEMYGGELSDVNGSSALTQPPPEVIAPMLTAAEIPAPVVAGDVRIPMASPQPAAYVPVALASATATDAAATGAATGTVAGAEAPVGAGATDTAVVSGSTLEATPGAADATIAAPVVAGSAAASSDTLQTPRSSSLDVNTGDKYADKLEVPPSPNHDPSKDLAAQQKFTHSYVPEAAGTAGVATVASDAPISTAGSDATLSSGGSSRQLDTQQQGVFDSSPVAQQNTFDEQPLPSSSSEKAIVPIVTDAPVIAAGPVVASAPITEPIQSSSSSDSWSNFSSNEGQQIKSAAIESAETGSLAPIVTTGETILLPGAAASSDSSAAGLSVPTASSKLSGEEESKRQRYEEEAKTLVDA